MKRKRMVLIVLLALMVSFLLCACKQHPYDEDWIIGKTSLEVEERYGKFDRLGREYQDDGLLYRTEAGYVIKESRVSWFGKTTEELFVVLFNQAGIAYSCGVAPGNWGG